MLLACLHLAMIGALLVLAIANGFNGLMVLLVRRAFGTTLAMS